MTTWEGTVIIIIQILEAWPSGTEKEAMQRAAGLDENPSQGCCPHPAVMGAGQALHRAGTAGLCHLMSGSHKGPHFIKQKRVYLVVQSVAPRISDQEPPWPSAVRHKRLPGMDSPAVPAQQHRKGCWLCQTSLEEAWNQGGAWGLARGLLEKSPDCSHLA